MCLNYSCIVFRIQTETLDSFLGFSSVKKLTNPNAALNTLEVPVLGIFSDVISVFFTKYDTDCSHS